MRPYAMLSAMLGALPGRHLHLHVHLLLHREQLRHRRAAVRHIIEPQQRSLHYVSLNVVYRYTVLRDVHVADLRTSQMMLVRP